MNTDAVAGRELWIGLATVKPRPGNDVLGAAKGAFVAVVADAMSAAEFLALVERELSARQFDTMALEDVEPLRARQSRAALPRELRQAIESISSGSPVAFGSFHAWAGEKQPVLARRKVT